MIANQRHQPSTVTMSAMTPQPNADRPGLDKDPSAIASMFDRVAARYDIVNDLLSLGQTKRWRRIVAETIAAKPGERVLDLAAGTGTSSVPLIAAGAEVISADFSLGMLQQGRRQYPHVQFIAADALRLPFADASFDVATISFGLRNVSDLDQALAELRRVVRPGGRLVICEFSAPTDKLLRAVYQRYLASTLRRLARMFASNPSAYEYLADSIAAWPEQAALAARLTAAHWNQVKWRNLTGGIVAIHRATR